jgi:two-component system, LytTR family, response regulator
MTAYIIDDEPFSSDALRVLLEKYCPEIEIKGIFNQSPKALEAIKNAAPNLLFLDIEMPQLNGFDLLRQCDDLTKFKVIFTTAYDQFALKAFKFNALHYLLKPIDKDELIQAVTFAQQQHRIINVQKLDAVQYLKNNPTPERIALPVEQELIFVEVKDIIYATADGAYVFIHVSNLAKPIIITKSLGALEDLMNNPNFFRVHKSFLINLKHIKKIVKTDGGYVEMSNGKQIDVARRKKDEFMELIVRL